MATFGTIDIPSSSPSGTTPNDFWRSGAGTTQPDGTNDTTEAISRRGAVAFGVGWPLADPTIPGIEVAGNARSGVDSRNANDAGYITGQLSGIYSCTPVSSVPGSLAGFKILHSNQTQGVGIFFDGIKAIGSNANQNLAFQQKGNGIISFQWEVLNGSYEFMDRYAIQTPGVGQGYNDRYFMGAGCTQIASEIVDVLSVTGGNQIRHIWQPALNGSLANGMRLNPSKTDCTGTTSAGVELWIDENRVGSPGVGFVAGVGGASGTLRNRKLVLFDSNSGNYPQDLDNFYGFGINNQTLRYQIDSTAAFNRWYARTGACQSQGIFSVSGVAIVTVDPAGLNTGVLNSQGQLRFGAESNANAPQIGSKRTAGANQFGLDFFINGVATPVMSLQPTSFKSAGLHLDLARVPTFLTDAAAGVGGLTAGDVWKDSAGLLHIKL